MTKFIFAPMEIPEVLLITPLYVADNRGYFLKSFESSAFQHMGIQGKLDETFESHSVRGVIRGMHFQTENPQGKLVRAIHGEIMDVAVDLRRNSPAFGTYCTAILNGDNHLALWIPPGFAHGFETLSAEALVSYSCIGAYHQASDTGIRWDDPHLAIPWHTKTPILSPRDAGLPSLETFIRQSGGLPSDLSTQHQKEAST